MKKEKYTIPVNLFPFGFADELATGKHINEEAIGLISSQRILNRALSQFGIMSLGAMLRKIVANHE